MATKASGVTDYAAAMASGDERASVPEGLTGEGLRIGVVRARWNAGIVDRLAKGVDRGLASLGVTDVVAHSVPGSFEIPLAAKTLAASGTVDAVVCIGAVIRGETTHYELVSGECGRGVQQAQLDTGVPVLFGVLTVENEAQAEARSQGPGGHNVGEEAALGAVEMAKLIRAVTR
ncbi:MAG: 6,7-dimethyl-8-ribityllumazine synthase [Acidimicrobiia bacterium]|nr:6,7-dimethyl-8-ribityllumazine synthase [Acidimicrobiia bacterium]